MLRPTSYTSSKARAHSPVILRRGSHCQAGGALSQNFHSMSSGGFEDLALAMKPELFPTIISAVFQRI